MTNELTGQRLMRLRAEQLEHAEKIKGLRYATDLNLRERLTIQTDAFSLKLGTENALRWREHMEAVITKAEEDERITGEAYVDVVEELTAWEPNAQKERTWDEVTQLCLEADKQTLGDDYQSFEPYFLGYIATFEEILRNPNEQNALLDQHAKAIKSWAKQYNKTI